MNLRIPLSLRELVRERAGGRCEYCLIHESDVLLPHEVDHIIAVKHRGQTDPSNLAYACYLCNRRKGTDIASIDPDTGQLTCLFNPRTDRWLDHLNLIGGRIVPLTQTGRVTVELLQLNDTERVEERRLLIEAGGYPTH